MLAARARRKPVLGFEPAWWRFLGESNARETLPRGGRLVGLGRLSEGASLESAQAELRLLAARLAPASGARPARSLRVAPVRDTVDAVAHALVASAGSSWPRASSWASSGGPSGSP